MTPLAEQVAIDLKNASENGWTFKGWTVEEVAVDLRRCCSDYERIAFSDLVEALKEVL